jgi:hypothetical protein
MHAVSRASLKKLNQDPASVCNLVGYNQPALYIAFGARMHLSTLRELKSVPVTLYSIFFFAAYWKNKIILENLTKKIIIYSLGKDCYSSSFFSTRTQWDRFFPHIPSDGTV